MTLVLEIEYLLGVSFATTAPDSDVPDWPPQPDRIFSALVATWAARGEKDGEQSALEWLEQQSSPLLLASDAEPRTGAIAYVPPNDSRSDRQKNAKGVLPALRSRQPRRFPAARPQDPVVRLCWPGTDPDQATLSALQGLARDTAYVGHSASLTRCRFLSDSGAIDHADARPPLRWVYRGRLAELRRAFDAGRRPLPGARVSPAPASPSPRSTVFDTRWLILEHVTGDMPDIRACAVVAKTLRDALLSGYQQIGLGSEIPEVVSGHSPDGAPTRAPHLAVVPLAFVGFPFADGHVMGFALVPPTGSTILDDEPFRAALRNIARLDKDSARRILTVTKAGTPPASGFSIGLSPTFEAPPGKRSIDPAFYLGLLSGGARGSADRRSLDSSLNIRPARTFATVTPIVLDRHLKEDGATRPAEIAALIAAACRNIGLPEPEAIVVDKHSAIEGAPSAYPSGKSPAWMRWRLPPPHASRQLTHAVIRFAAPVEGPLILGAGRFLGLGLCRPLASEA